MKETIEQIKIYLNALNIEEITSLRTLVEEYLIPLKENSQISSHHAGENTLQHVLLVIDTLSHLLIFLKREEGEQVEQLNNYPEVESALQSELKPETRAKMQAYLKENIDGMSKEVLLFYASLLHDVGKINLLKRYRKRIAKYSHYSNHHLFGALVVNYYGDCVRDIEEYRQELTEKKARVSKEENLQKIERGIKYLQLVERFLNEHRQLLEDVSFTQKQFNFISSLIRFHHDFSGSFNEYKIKGKIPKKTKRLLRFLNNENILIGESLLFYSDVMSCLHLFGHRELKIQLVSFIDLVIDTFYTTRVFTSGTKC